MSSQSFLKEILIELSKNNIKYIVFGGVAIVLHGVERMTLDLDLSLQMSEENLRKFLQIMDMFNMTPRAPVSPEILLNKDIVEYIKKEKNAIAFTFIDKDNPYKQVDVLIHDLLEYEKWKNKIQEIEIFGYKICILSKEAIIELKEKMEIPRDKDLFDIKELKKKGG